MDPSRAKGVEEAWEEVLAGSTPTSGPAGLEPWTLFALLVSGLTFALFLYLALRPGGRGPLVVWDQGRMLAFLVAAATLVAGVVWGVLRRPVLQRRRLAGFLGLGVALFITSYPLAYPSSYENHPSRTAFRLPFEGGWTTRWGGNKGPQNALVLRPDVRFGFHFVQTDGAGKSDGRCLGARVLAPADGEVVRVEDGIPDGPEGRGTTPEQPRGNLVVLRTAPGEFLHVSNLAQGSIPVAVGQTVRAGQELGRVGASALSRVTPEPHLAIHLQDTDVPGAGEGIPMSFHGYFSGGREVERGVPRGGLAGDGSHLGEQVAPVSGAGAAVGAGGAPRPALDPSAGGNPTDG